MRSRSWRLVPQIMEEIVAVIQLFLRGSSSWTKSLTCPLLSTTGARWFRYRKLWRSMAQTIEISQLQYI